jgi:GT2 family glycosyltransferase
MTLVRADTGQDDGAGRGFSAAAAAAQRPVLGLTVSVVICASSVDRWDDLKQAVISVGSQAAGEIVLVVDHCAELVTQAGVLARLLPWNIAVVPNRFGPGLAGARNTGVAVAQGDIVAFLDDRAVAGPGWLAALAGHYQDPRVLGVGGMVRAQWPDGRPSWFPPELDWAVGCSYQGMPAGSVAVRAFLAAGMSFRRTVLEECGGFSSVLSGAVAAPPGWQDTELCLRIARRHPEGILVYDPAAVVSYQVPGTAATGRSLRSACYAQGRSRALTARLAGPSRAFAPGRSYAGPGLPGRIWRCLTHPAGGRLSGLMAALTLIIAAAITTAGHLAGTITARRVTAYPPLPAGQPQTAPGTPPPPPDATPDEPQASTATIVFAALPDGPPAPTDAAPGGSPAPPDARPDDTIQFIAAAAFAAPPALPDAVLAAPPALPDAAPDDTVQFIAAAVFTAPPAQPDAVPDAPPAPPDVASAPTEKFSTRSRRRAALLPWLNLAACLALWVSALGATDVGRLQSAGLGLASIMPFTYWAALAVLMGGFAWAVTRRGSRWPLLTAHLVVLVAILHATPAILYGSLRYSWTWKHIGVIDYIATNGIHFNLGGALGVYQGWPGFFALNAFLTSASGLHTALGYASWVLPLNDLLWLGPVILIARAFTSDWRIVWTAAWIFEIGNWIGQDYFSPQAFTYFLYLTVIAVCLRWLWHPRIGPPPSMAEAGEATGHPQPRRRVMVLCLVPLMAAIASSHQLTPFMLLSALILLVAFRQLRPRTLPLLMAAITVGWNLYGGLPWLKVNTNQILGGLGDPWSNISTHIVGGQGQVPSGQILVDWDTRALSAAIGILALIGFWRYRRHHDAKARSSWNRLAVLAVAAFPAAAANSYGGEIIFRVFLFALPFMAVAAAACFFPTPGRNWSLRSATIVALTTFVLVTGATIGNYGQEAMNYFTPGEVAASEWLYRTAPSGALIIAADNNYPWAFVHYNEYSYAFLDVPPSASKALLRAPVQNITRIMTRSPGPAYLILTNSQAVSIKLAGLWPPGAYQSMVHALLASGKLKVVYRNGDAVILQLAK